MKNITHKEYMYMRKLIKEYNYLVERGIRKGQYIIVRKLNPLLKRTKATIEHQVETILVNEQIRRGCYKSPNYNVTGKRIGQSKSIPLKKIKKTASINKASLEVKDGTS